jgi:hypothetical protein
MAAEPDELTLLIAQRLEIDWQYVEYVEAWNTERIAQVRAAGRKAGRVLGFKVVTRQSDPALREDNRVVVIVAVTDGPSQDDRDRIDERAVLIVDQIGRDRSQALYGDNG